TWTFTFIPVALGASNGQVDLWDWFSSNGLSTSFVTGLTARKLIIEPANANRVIAAASYSTRRTWTNCEGNPQSNTLQVDPGNLSPFSSPGPTRDGRQKPDIAAPGAAIGSTLSFDAGLTCPDINGELLMDG